MHSEDDDINLPLAFHQRRHEQRSEGEILTDISKSSNWRLKERVSCCCCILSFLEFNDNFTTDEDGVGSAGAVS